VARLIHGTKAQLETGQLIEPGHRANFGRLGRDTTHVYLTGTLDSPTWGAELALGEGGGRIYVVERAGGRDRGRPESDGHEAPRQSDEVVPSREPLRVSGELEGRQGHSAEELAAMRAALERLERHGVEPLD
jgi:rifampin ADP-ribosylating transferase